MTVQPGLCRTGSEPKLFVFSRTVSYASYLCIGTDKSSDTHDATIGKQLGDLGYTSDILFSVFLGEAQILVEPRTNVVSVQTVCGNSLTDEVLFKGEGDCGLAGSG